eukprot:UN07246
MDSAAFFLCFFLSAFLSPLSLVIIAISIKFLLCSHSIQSGEKNVYEDNKIKRYKLTISLPLSIRYLTICSMIIYFISHILSVIDMFCTIDGRILWCTINKYGESISNKFVDKSRNPLATTFWYWGRTLMNIVFIFRLKHSFKDTIFKSNKCVFRALYCLLCSLPICTLYLNILAICIDPVDPGFVFFVLPFFILELCDFTFSTSLLLIFQCKLLQVIKSYIKSIQSAETNMR